MAVDNYTMPLILLPILMFTTFYTYGIIRQGMARTNEIDNERVFESYKRLYSKPKDIPKLKKRLKDYMTNDFAEQMQAGFK